MDEVNQSFEKVLERMHELENRFIAFGIDFSSYRTSKLIDDEIMEIRDNTKYRLFSAIFHSNLTLTHELSIKQLVSQQIKGNMQEFLFIQDPKTERFEQEVTSLFDSTLYHLVSVFDYLGRLINYTCLFQKNTKYMKWNSLVKFIRDRQRETVDSMIDKLVLTIQSEFVNKLTEYRSDLIHRRPYISSASRHINISQEGREQEIIFYAPDDLVKRFHFLKNKSKEERITLSFALFWIIDLVIDSTNDVLFTLKSELEKSGNLQSGILLFDKGTLSSPSRSYWKSETYTSRFLNNDAK